MFKTNVTCTGRKGDGRCDAGGVAGRRLDPRSAYSIAGLIDRAKREVLPGFGRNERRGTRAGDTGIMRRLVFRPAAGSGKPLILEPQPEAKRFPKRPNLLARAEARPNPYVTALADGEKDAASEEPPFHQSKEVLDRIERTYRGYVALARKRGWTETANNLERFLSGKGGVKHVDRERARGMEPIRKAEETNKQRFENSFLSYEKNGHATKLDKLRDGQSVLFKDHWDRDFTSIQHAIRSELDMALSTGGSDFRSEGEFKATRKGDVIHVEGTVSHKWSDTYDFHSMESFADGALALQEHRGAKPFDIKAGWKQKIHGTIRIKSGKLSEPKFNWKDEN